MTRKALPVAAGALLLGLVLAGCGTGKDAATSQTLPSIPGVNAEEAGIAIRNAVVIFDPQGYSAGDDAPIQLTVFNDTERQVSLTQATSTGAASVEPEDELRLAPGGFATATLQATGLTEPLDGTVSLPVDLTFSNGAELSLQVPTATPLDAQPRGTPVPDEAEPGAEEH